MKIDKKYLKLGALGGAMLAFSACSNVQEKIYDGFATNGRSAAFVGQMQTRQIQDLVSVICTPGNDFMENYRTNETTIPQKKPQEISSNKNQGFLDKYIFSPFSDGTNSLTEKLGVTSNYDIQKCRDEGIGIYNNGVKQMSELLDYNAKNNGALNLDFEAPAEFNDINKTDMDRLKVSKQMLEDLLSITGYKREPVGVSIFVSNLNKMYAHQGINAMEKIKSDALKRDSISFIFWSGIGGILSAGSGYNVASKGGNAVITAGKNAGGALNKVIGKITK